MNRFKNTQNTTETSATYEIRQDLDNIQYGLKSKGKLKKNKFKNEPYS